nr:MAG TPA_asm: hypothetical protein [Caudoviricetes sp.]DAL75490.1 MAG TPA: hypothetical protein [Caudoviricetes sp.]
MALTALIRGGKAEVRLAVRRDARQRRSMAKRSNGIAS